MFYTVRHTTSYQYDEPVTQGFNRAHLLPRDTNRHRVITSRIDVKPAPAWLRNHEDYYGNKYAYFMMQAPHKSLDITITSEVEYYANQPMLALTQNNLMTCYEVRQALQNIHDDETLAATEFTLPSPMIPISQELQQFAQDLFVDEAPFLPAVRALNSRIFEQFEYDPEFTNVATPIAEALAHKKGVCQDFAHVAIASLRSCGFAARYVSGYLETLPPPGQEKMIGADASHAWFAVYVPDCGWHEFDPTNNNEPEGQHIVTAWGRDYSDVTPLRGVFFGGGKTQKLDVAVDVIRRE